jgi:hypothetical protein
VDALTLSAEAQAQPLPKSSGGLLPRLAAHYTTILRSRLQWVGFAGQSLFFNPFLAAADMFFVHPGAAHGAMSRVFANGWAALGTCGIYSTGRDEIFCKLGLLEPKTPLACAAAMAADTAYGFALNLPGFIVNYIFSGCAIWPSVFLGFKAAAFASWTSSISGGLFDTFGALDSDDPQKKARAPSWVRWLVIDRFALNTRRKLIWISLAASVLASAAIYCYAPHGLLRRQ